MQDNFIGLPLEEVKTILEKQKVRYFVTNTSGGKDEDILKDEYVICVKNDNDVLELIVTNFKSNV